MVKDQKKMGKTHKLTDVEQKHLMGVGNIAMALNSWGNTLEYLIGLVEKDRQKYVETVVRPRLKLKPSKADKPDININAEMGLVEEL